MGVYVGPLYKTPTSENWRWTEAAKLIADSVGELHDFAGKLGKYGLPEDWFYDFRCRPFYVIDPFHYAEAIRKGARQLNKEQVIQKLRSCYGY